MLNLKLRKAQNHISLTFSIQEMEFGIHSSTLSIHQSNINFKQNTSLLVI